MNPKWFLHMAGFVAAFFMGYLIGSPGHIEKRPDNEALESLLSKASEPKLPEGTGRIHGRVLTEEGVGLAGVRIRAAVEPENRSTREWLRTDSPMEAPLSDSVLRYVASRQSLNGAFKECFTDAEGRFALTTLPDLYYSVFAFSGGYKIDPKPASSHEGIRTECKVDFIAQSMLKLPVKVTFPDGSIPEEALLEGRLAGEMKIDGRSNSYYRSISRKWTAKEPYLFCRKGRCRIQDFAGDRWEYMSDSQSCLLSPGKPVPELTLVLKKRLSIHGNVILPDDVLPGARIYVYKAAAGPHTDFGAGALLQAKSYGKNSLYLHSPNTAFQFRDVRSGTYLLGAGWSYDGVAVIRKISVQDGPVEESLVLPLPDLQDCIVLRVFDPSGRLVRDAEIDVKFGEGDEAGFVHTNVIRKRDGAYWILLGTVHQQDLPDDGQGARYEIQVVTDSYGAKMVTWRANEPRTLAVRLAPPASLELVLSDYADSPYRGRIWLEARQGNVYKSFEEGDIKNDGTMAIAGLQPGPCTLMVMPISVPPGCRPMCGHGFHFLCRKEYQFDLKPGRNRKTIPIPELFTVVLRTEEWQPDVWAELYSLDYEATVKEGRSFEEPREGARHTEKIDDKGLVVFRDVPPGKYRARVFSSCYPGDMNVVVTGDAVFDYKPKLYNAFKVGYSDGGDPMRGGRADFLDEENDDLEKEYAEYGFQKGDLIVGAEGRRFTTVSDVDHLAWIARIKKEIQLAVIRNGSEIPVTIAHDELLEFLDFYAIKKVHCE